MPQDGEEIAGGMSYRTRKGIRTSSLISSLEGQDNQSQWVIFKRNQDYYIASTDKTIARLKLAKTRVKCTGISGKQYLMLMDKISDGLDWLRVLKNQIKSAVDNSNLQLVVSYKKWHAVKLIPIAAEGYAITYSLKMDIDNLKNHSLKLSHKKNLEDAKSHNDNAKELFMYLLNLQETSDFSTAEKRLLEAYEETETALKILEHIQKD